jgi:hypothetical protein
MVSHASLFQTQIPDSGDTIWTDTKDHSRYDGKQAVLDA